MANVDFTYQDMRKLFAEEREYARQTVSEIVQDSGEDVKTTIIGESTNFIKNNLDPAIESLQTSIDRVESRVVTLESDMQEVKLELRAAHSA